MNAFATALVVGTLVILVAAVVVFIFLPSRAHDAREPLEGALDGVAWLAFAEAEAVLESTPPPR